MGGQFATTCDLRCWEPLSLTRLLSRQSHGEVRRGGETRGPTRRSPAPGPPSLFFDCALVGVRSASTHARCLQTVSTSAHTRCRRPSYVASEASSWFPSLTNHGFVRRCPSRKVGSASGPSSLATFLTSSSTEVLCCSFWEPCSFTLDLDVVAASVQLQRTTHDDPAWQ